MSKEVTEKQVEKYLVKTWGKVMHGMCIKFPPLFFRGFPDRICLAPGGVIVFVEVKRPGEVARAIQLKVHSQLRALGFRVEVLDSYEAVDGLIVSL